jgi:hypothetical protein
VVRALGGQLLGQQLPPHVPDGDIDVAWGRGPRVTITPSSLATPPASRRWRWSEAPPLAPGTCTSRSRPTTSSRPAAHHRTAPSTPTITKRPFGWFTTF